MHYAEGDAEVAPPSGFGQLLRGVGNAINPWAAPGAAESQFAAARDNPASSPATSTLGQFGSYLGRDIRAQQAAKGPTFGEWLGNIFTGDTQSTADLQDRHNAAVQLRDPAVQQNLISNPDKLAVVERDPRAYVASPAFQDFIQQAQKANAAAVANPRIASADEQNKTVDKSINAGVHPDVAHVAVAPHKYTEDEFVNTFKGIPTATFMQLFGAQLAHVRTPQEKAATEFFDQMHGRYADLNDTVKQMEAEDAALAKEGKSKKHDVYKLPFTGKNAYDTAKEERDKAMAATMNALQKFISPQSFPTN
jgi:hypothetical protein